MRRIPFLPVFCTLVLTVGLALPARAGFLDDLLKGSGLLTEAGPGDDQIVAGLKEALSVGTGNAVVETSKADGYFGHPVIRILLPEKVRKAGDLLRKVGYQREVDEFVLSMNRAAERAAPRAKTIFVDAIRGMTFDDARRILNGGDTAATEYFRGKTSGRLFEEFRPIVSSSMDEVGATRSYKRMMGKYASLPFAKSEELDLDRYVTDKALEGLFHMVAQEEVRIRKDPAARVTELLRTVFGGR